MIGKLNLTLLADLLLVKSLNTEILHEIVVVLFIEGVEFVAEIVVNHQRASAIVLLADSKAASHVEKHPLLVFAY